MTQPYEDETLLEYETEAEPVPDVVVPVCISEPVVTVETVPQHMQTYTVVVASGTNGGIAELLPLDPLRVRATIIVSDNPVVLCHSKTLAQNGANTASNVPTPQGAYVANSTTPLVLTGTSQLFVAATVSSSTRVSVISERRTP